MSLVNRPSDREVIFSRLFDAPRELVWQAWTSPEQVHRWWGPDGFTTTTQEFVFAPGGVWRFVMHGPAGTEYPNRVVFREIEPPSRLVYENGWDTPGAELNFRVVTTLVEEGKRTRLSLHMTFANAKAMQLAVERYGVLQGGEQTLGRLAAHLAAGRGFHD